MSRSVKCRACSRSPWSPPPSSPRPEGEARPVPPIRKREFIMTLYFPENTYYELPFKEVVYYAFHGHSCVSRQPRSGRGGGGGREEGGGVGGGVFFTFFSRELKYRSSIFSCFSRIKDFFSGSLSSPWIPFWKFCLYPYVR